MKIHKSFVENDYWNNFKHYLLYKIVYTASEKD